MYGTDNSHTGIHKLLKKLRFYSICFLKPLFLNWLWRTLFQSHTQRYVEWKRSIKHTICFSHFLVIFSNFCGLQYIFHFTPKHGLFSFSFLRLATLTIFPFCNLSYIPSFILFISFRVLPHVRIYLSSRFLSGCNVIPVHAGNSDIDFICHSRCELCSFGPGCFECR